MYVLSIRVAQLSRGETAAFHIFEKRDEATGVVEVRDATRDLQRGAPYSQPENLRMPPPLWRRNNSRISYWLHFEAMQFASRGGTQTSKSSVTRLAVAVRRLLCRWPFWA
jgi:hypothetical protein